MTKKVIVAMSGGVDSSVAAALLKRGGVAELRSSSRFGSPRVFDVRGVFIKIWSDPFLPCTSKEDRLDALRVAVKLKIPFQTWDLSQEYKKAVVNYMISEYKAGQTPNPDVMCNKYIKFGLFLKRALKEGADYVATGHYVRLRREIRNPKSEIRKLLMAKDKNKDQSYFLWTLTQKQLHRCLFPIGDYTKPQVRKLAKKFGLPTASKKDSQGICFLGKINVTDFLRKRIREKPGPILTTSRQRIGQHQGLFFYTIGQRKGIGLAGGPYFVSQKDFKKNTLIVTKNEKDLLKKELVCAKVNWIAGREPKLPLRLQAVIRYRARPARATISKTPGAKDRKQEIKYRIQFAKRQKAIAPGQSVVFYKNQELLGGGIIVH